MNKSNEELAREIRELRDELRQMREIVGVLFSLMVESDEEEEEYADGLGHIEMPRMNN